MINPTQIEANKLADNYISRLKSKEFNNYMEMHNAILNNVVNSEYGRTSNMYVDYLWQRINAKLFGYK